jgi:hypothetical protein
VFAFALAGLEAEHVSDQRAGQQLDHHGDVRALEAAEGQLGSCKRLSRIGRGLTVGADGPSFRQGFSVAQSKLDLTPCGGALLEGRIEFQIGSDRLTLDAGDCGYVGDRRQAPLA